MKKKCPRCETWKTSDQYYINPYKTGTSYYTSSYCLDCAKRYGRARFMKMRFTILSKQAEIRAKEKTARST
jgi:hypothetical protein